MSIVLIRSIFFKFGSLEVKSIRNVLRGGRSESSCSAKFDKSYTLMHSSGDSV